MGKYVKPAFRQAEGSPAAQTLYVGCADLGRDARGHSAAIFNTDPITGAEAAGIRCVDKYFLRSTQVADQQAAAAGVQDTGPHR